MNQNQYGQSYIGNDDFRGYLAALAAAEEAAQGYSPNRLALTANRMGYVDNEGNVNMNVLRGHVQGVSGSDAALQEQEAARIQNLYNQWQAARQGGGGGGGGLAQADPDAAAREELRGRIRGRGSEIDAAYAALFGDLDNLIRARSQELDRDYGEQLERAGSQYAAYLPQIESSYSALGAANSTDLRDANLDAKSGFEDTTKTIGRNKEKDQSALGQFRRESEARFSADRDAARSAVSQADTTTDVNALRGFANQLEENLRGTGVTRATLGTEGEARQQLLGMTADGGRSEAAMNALDAILKSSMSGDVKSAAVEAITNAGGLTDEEKKRVQQQYGNVYAEQASL